jgi:hypothetical protein
VIGYPINNNCKNQRKRLYMKDQTFAYIVLSSSYKKEIETMYWGGVIEAFISCEEQWIEPKDIWPFEWEKFMYRNAVVQLTNDWDPRLALLNIFKDINIEPSFRQVLNGEKDNIIYFDKIPSTTSVNVFTNKKSKEYERFVNILSDAVILSKKKQLGLLFIGGWGFSYDINLKEEDQLLLKDIGIKYCSRII